MTKQLSQAVQNSYLNIVFFISFLGVIGSLFASEVANLPPCSLCWFQRVALYPIALFTGIALWTKDTRFTHRYILALGIPGMLVAFYHYLMEQGIITEAFFPSCNVGIPCNQIQFELAGFITIPLMSFVAFGVINLLCIWKIRHDKLSAE